MSLGIHHKNNTKTRVVYFSYRNVHKYLPSQNAAVREMQEETGFIIECGERLDLYEVIEPHYQSIAVIFGGHIIGGTLKAEIHPKYGKKEAQWFTIDELQSIRYHPQPVIDKLFRWKT